MYLNCAFVKCFKDCTGSPWIPSIFLDSWGTLKFQGFPIYHHLDIDENAYAIHMTFNLKKLLWIVGASYIKQSNPGGEHETV